MHNNISAIAHHTSKPSEVISKIKVKENNIIENIILTIWYGKTFSHTVLMKWPCLAVKACQQYKYLIVLYIEKLLKHNINRMRGLIKLLQQRYGKITIKTYRKWEKIEIKMSNYRNHLGFSLRCLDRGLIPVSLRLKNLLRTQRGKGIIYKTERRLLNERIKNINMTLQHYEQEGYMYQHDLKQQIEQNWWEECKAEINKVRELRHNTVMERQTRKFTKLFEEKEKHQERHFYHSGHTNYIDHTKADGSIKPSNTNKKWVINLSSIPLTKDQESLLCYVGQ